MASDTNSSWFPTFEFENWICQSFLVVPTPEENSAPPGAAITAKKWAKGTFRLFQLRSPEGYAGDGTLYYDSPPPTPSGPALDMSVKGALGSENTPATFEATGTGTEGITKGAIYQLFGWVFRGQDGRVESVHGSIRAVRGPDATPETELGGRPVGTVGSFIMVRSGTSY